MKGFSLASAVFLAERNRREANRALFDQALEPRGGNTRLECTGQKAIALGASVPEPFTANDLAARLDGDGVGRAYQWLGEWKRRSWIRTIGFNLYQRTAEFGK